MNYADWLAARMLERRLTGRNLALRAGVNHSTVSRILVGRRPTTRTVALLSDVLGWPPLETLRETARE